MTLALIGVGMAAAAILGAWLLVRRHPKEHPFQVKAVLFGLYFWGLVFFELIVAAAIYALRQP